jgi:hypothetical protein
MRLSQGLSQQVLNSDGVSYSLDDRLGDGICMAQAQLFRDIKGEQVWRSTHGSALSPSVPFC